MLNHGGNMAKEQPKLTQTIDKYCNLLPLRVRKEMIGHGSLILNHQLMPMFYFS